MELLTATDTADRLGISDSTLRKWARRGRISRETAPNGQPFYRREDVERLLQEEARWRAGTGADRAGAVTSGDDRSGPGQQGSAATGHDRAGLSPDAATSGQYFHHVDHRAELLEQERDHLRDDRQRQAEEIAHLRALLDRRGEEIQRRDHAEAELRRLLLSAQQLAHELAQQLEVKALPAHNDVQPDPKKVRWWMPWRR